MEKLLRFPPCCVARHHSVPLRHDVGVSRHRSCLVHHVRHVLAGHSRPPGLHRRRSWSRHVRAAALALVLQGLQRHRLLHCGLDDFLSSRPDIEARRLSTACPRRQHGLRGRAPQPRYHHIQGIPPGRGVLHLQRGPRRRPSPRSLYRTLSHQEDHSRLPYRPHQRHNCPLDILLDDPDHGPPDRAKAAREVVPLPSFLHRPRRTHRPLCRVARS
mmetsp:Transcript_6801/g.11679  ORF Transcript_6801/g.11679 Transcript_6801/m.11679 type:complete len:215 (+) Transcript_6801:523-1167(+)